MHVQQTGGTNPAAWPDVPRQGSVSRRVLVQIDRLAPRMESDSRSVRAWEHGCLTSSILPPDNVEVYEAALPAEWLADMPPSLRSLVRVIRLALVGLLVCCCFVTQSMGPRVRPGSVVKPLHLSNEGGGLKGSL